MIAKSDVIILVISASALAAGIFRWQSNMNMLSTAQSTVSSPGAAVVNRTNPVNASVANGSTNAIAANATTIVTGNPANNNTPVVDLTNENKATTEIVSSNVATPSESNAQDAEPLYGVYKVRSGDFLGKIANTFGTTVDQLRSINNISGSLIDIDQEIKYPLPAN